MASNEDFVNYLFSNGGLAHGICMRHFENNTCGNFCYFKGDLDIIESLQSKS